MNLTRIYKAIDEGLKLSLIDFGTNKILKSSYVDSGIVITKKDIDNWYKSGEDISEYMYKELCRDKYIGFYKVENNDQLNNIFMRIPFKNINLNWIAASNIIDFEFYDYKDYKYDLNICHWDINKIPDRAFSGCNSLNSIVIPNNVVIVGSCSFWMCGSLASINIPDGAVNIKNGAFLYCSSLKSIKVPNSITSIDEAAFWNCAIQSINIPNSMNSISDGTFQCCYFLTSILIPDSVISIGKCAFGECTALTSIQYGGTKKQWNAIKLGKDPFYNVNCIVHCLDGDIKINN